MKLKKKDVEVVETKMHKILQLKNLKPVIDQCLLFSHGLEIKVIIII